MSNGVMETAAGYYAVNKPSIWRRLGFGYPRPNLFDWINEEPRDLAPGYMATRTECKVGFVDRLRLLLSGRCEITVLTKADVMVSKMESRSQFAVLPPTR